MADHDAVARAHGFHTVGVRRVIDETQDARTFVLDVPDDLADVFVYRPGQFCTVRCHVDGEELLRSYSMSSAPETHDELMFTVKRVPEGRVSNWLHDHVTAGDTLEVTPPAGVFCADDDTRPIVAFCGGSGVTPVISIAAGVLAATTRDVHVLYANRDAASVIFADRWTDLEREYGERLRLERHLDVDGGLLTAADVATFADTTGDASYYICGPTPFMDLVESTLRNAGVPDDRIHLERFVNAGQRTGDAAVPSPSDVEGVERPDTGGDGTDASAGEAPTEQVTIILRGTSHEIAYRPGDTILQTARGGGLSAPFSCEAGNCATCMALVRDGTATMRTNNALTPEEVDEGWVLTCQARPTSPTVTVEYESF